MADTAALVVALSAQLTKFEKDMKQAADIAAKRTKDIEGSFSRVNKLITGQLTVLSGRAGGAGTVLTSFGKAGIFAAAGLGAAVLAMTAAVAITSDFVEQADRLEQSAENLGITITQMKALGIAGEVANQSFEKTEQSFIKFIGGVEALRDAQGPLYEALRKTDKALLLQLTNAKDSAEAIDILVQAFAKLNTQAEKIALARAAGFTRGGVGILEELSKSAGLTGAAAGLKNIDEATKRLADFKKEVEAIRRKAFDMIGEFITTNGLDFLRTTVREFQAIGAVFTAIGDAIDRIRAANAANGPQTSTGAEFQGVPSTEPLPRSRPAVPAAPLRATPEQVLDGIRRANAAMGDAVTLTQQLAQRQAELNVAVEKGDITRTQANKAIEIANLAQKAAVAATLERLGIADLEIIQGGKIAEIEAARAKQLITTEQALKATTLAMREAKEEADKLAVRRALLPGLKQLELDIANTSKEIDKFAVSSLSNIENAFVDLASGTKTLSDAFREMVSSILKDLARLLIRQQITGPLAQLLGSLGGGGNTGGFGLQIGGQAGGTNNWGGGWTWVGEKGPELVNLPKGSQVVPNDVSRGGVGGVSVGVTSTIVVQGDASERTLMLIEGALARQKRELPNDIIKTVQQMKSRRSA